MPAVTRNSDIAALHIAMTGLHNRPLDARKTSGEVRFKVAQATLVATEAVDDVIRVCRVRKGMLIPRAALGFRLCNVGGATASITLKLGVAYDSAALTSDAEAISTGGAMTPSTNYMVRPTFTATDGKHAAACWEAQGDGWLIATVTAVNHGTTPAAGDTIDFLIPMLAIA